MAGLLYQIDCWRVISCLIVCLFYCFIAWFQKIYCLISLHTSLRVALKECCGWKIKRISSPSFDSIFNWPLLFECLWWLNGNLFWKFNEWKTKPAASYALNNFLDFVFNYKPIKCRLRSNRLLIESVTRAQRFDSFSDSDFFSVSPLLCVTYINQNTKQTFYNSGWFMKIQT